MAPSILPAEFADYENLVNPDWRKNKNPKIVKKLNGFIIFKIRNWKAVDGTLYNYFKEGFNQIPLTL
jgi:hypothetical protein